MDAAFAAQKEEIIKKTINLKYIAYWKEPFCDLINTRIPINVLNKILALDPYQGCKEYYTKAEELFGYYCDLNYDFMIGFLRDNYSDVIGYHATKQKNPSMIKEKGLKALTKDEYIETSIKLFGKFNSEQEIINVVNSFEDRINTMNIEFAFYKSNFQDDFTCSYLIYGSETLLGIANMLDAYNCREVLRNNNIPLIYKCIIPIAFITEMDSVSLFITMFTRCLMKMTNPNMTFGNTMCFELDRKQLEPKYIKNYEIITRRIIERYYDHCVYQYNKEIQ